MDLWQCRKCKLAWESRSLFNDYHIAFECPNCESTDIFYGPWLIEKMG